GLRRGKRSLGGAIALAAFAALESIAARRAIAAFTPFAPRPPAIPAVSPITPRAAATARRPLAVVAHHPRRRWWRGAGVLTHGQRDAALVRVHGEHGDVDALAHGEHVAHVVDTLVAHLRDVHEAVDAGSQVHERPEIGEAHDHPGNTGALRELLRRA